MKLSDAVWQCYRTSKLGCIVAERLYGKGTLIMITDPFLLSNEAMRTSRDTALIAKLLGTPSEFIFDEEALGIEETGSITALMRRYGLTGAIGVLLVLGVLFLWRSMSSLLPPRERDETAGLVGRSAVVGLVNLYRRAIPKNQLISTCFAQWSKAKAATFAVHQDRISRMETASKAGGDPVAAYNAIARILREKL